MVERRYIFPGVIEMNVQARRRLGVNIYLIDGGDEYVLIDVGFLDELADVLELIRQMDFSLSACKMIVATHADADHTQGLARAREVLKCPVAAHPKSVAAAGGGRRDPDLRPDRRPGHPHPDAPLQGRPDDRRGGRPRGRRPDARGLEHPRPHRRPARLPDGRPALLAATTSSATARVGVIDAHHGSNLPDFIASLKRIRRGDVEVPAPLATGRSSARTTPCSTRRSPGSSRYTHMADFGTCAVDWPLLDEWEDELATGKSPV